MEAPTKLLIVDDDALILSVSVRALKTAQFEIITASTCAECIVAMEQHDPDILLLDVDLPDGNGIELCRQLKSDPESSGTFIILISARWTESESQAAGLEGGADGYIARPVSNRELLARVESMDRLRRKETELMKAQTQLAEQARKDELTGLYNRRFFAEFIEKEAARGARHDHPIGLLMIDVDRFKQINDRYGHQQGDAVLKGIARLLLATVRSSDLVIRYGGDEFLIVLSETGESVDETAARVRAAVRNNRELHQMVDFDVSISVGSVFWRPELDMPIAEALALADGRMYDDKSSR